MSGIFLEKIKTVRDIITISRTVKWFINTLEAPVTVLVLSPVTDIDKNQFSVLLLNLSSWRFSASMASSTASSKLFAWSQATKSSPGM